MKTFGEFIREKRLERSINLRKLAEMLDIAPAYMSDIENNKRNPPSNEKMEKLIEILSLTEEEINEMYDIAASSRENTVAPDISEYVMSEEVVRVALRKAKGLNLGAEEWLEIIKKMDKGDDSK